MSGVRNEVVAPARSGSAAAAICIIAAYQAVVSPVIVALFGRACRFEPSCSQYARIAIGEHGIGRGAYIAMRRLLRCHPWGGHGYDPVPRPIGRAISGPRR